MLWVILSSLCVNNILVHQIKSDNEQKNGCRPLVDGI